MFITATTKRNQSRVGSENESSDNVVQDTGRGARHKSAFEAKAAPANEVAGGRVALAFLLARIRV